jgi:hypothetical protein
MVIRCEFPTAMTIMIGVGGCDETAASIFRLKHAGAAPMEYNV